uniref:helix-turn-helix domain-containing protein n=1 Tax=Herbidospora sakaeratensis TaxID=564415 RepID=UPI000783AD0A|nr:helix-turn-helix domain-containing protein [Herbidospora sakaeratensis]
MAHARRGENRGPGAAAENRAALIAAAREVFAADGYRAPLASITKAARVGQGSLYRHFPDRVSLALAVFADNMTELEALAARPGVTLDEVLALITRHTIASTAFVDMVADADVDERAVAIRDRVTELLEAPLARAQADGLVRAEVGAGDLMLAIEMLAGALRHTPADDRVRAADRAWRLMRDGFATT